MEATEDIKSKYGDYTKEQFLELVASMQTTIDYLKHQLFSKKSERRTADPEGMKSLFDEAEQILAESEEDDDEVEKDDNSNESSEEAEKKKKRGKRKPLPKNLPRERVEHDLSEDEKVCSIHGTALIRLGEQSTEQLEIIPAQIKVIDHVTFTYKCPCCSEEGEKENIIKSTSEPSPIAKSFAGPGLLSYIATSKYCDALPLYRLEKILARYGIEISRTTMARWIIQCAGLVVPLINLMREDLLGRKVLGCDETPVQVLDEPQRKPEQMSFMWVMTSLEGAPIILFKYDTGRSAKTARDLLGEFSGTVVCDGLKSYDSFARSSDVTLAGCMAHVRRKFYQAEKAIKKAAPKTKPKTAVPLDLIRKLYRIEEFLKGQPPDVVLAQRQELSKPLMDQLKEWLDLEVTRNLPKSLIGKAIAYALDQWSKMQVFLENPLVPIDNNPTERCIRPFVIGRGNWMFSQSQAGAEASANLYSLIESAKANGIEPYDYLMLIFKELPKATEIAQFEKLLPHKIKDHFNLKA